VRLDHESLAEGGEHMPIIVYFYLGAFFGSLAASLAITPLVRWMALRRGFVDAPDGHRKLHTDAVSLGGGLAVLIAVSLTLVVLIGGAIATGTIPLDAAPLDPTFWVGLLVAAALLTVVGVIDDSIRMRGRHKLAGQVVACLTLIMFGLRIDSVSAFHLNVELGLLAVPVTLGWLLGTINALNLLDGADGLVSSVGGLLSLTIAALLALNGNVAESLVAVALAGALVGFLRYNLPPASIYQGDTGSMLIGLVLGALVIRGHVKGSASVAFFAPLCVMAIPMFDTLAALTRRKLTGRSLFSPDRGHFHHMLLHRGCTVSQTVLIVVGVCLATCIGALASVYFRKDVVAVGTIVLVIGTLVGCRLFGHVEFGLVMHRLTSGLPWRASQAGISAATVRRAYHLYGSRNWNDLWTALTESAERFGLVRMEFRILLPLIHESFYAVWSKPNGATDEEQWSAKSPLFLDGRLAGSLLLAGHSPQSAIQAISELADFLEPIEDQIRDVATGTLRLDGVAACPDQGREGASAQGKEMKVTHVTSPAALNPSPSSLAATAVIRAGAVGVVTLTAPSRRNGTCFHQDGGVS
jgi:UDP-GlcNAc:undecaprenyl-phosphate/decaprenyl-phosphate GlcNAc-1-phosphate transferase